MRLTSYQRQILRLAAKACFGESAQVRLFGSRVNDAARGGDIDLFITTDLQDPAEVLKAELQFQVRVQQALGEQKIDLLIDYPGRKFRPPIFAVAEHNGVPL